MGNRFPTAGVPGAYLYPGTAPSLGLAASKDCSVPPSTDLLALLSMDLLVVPLVFDGNPVYRAEKSLSQLYGTVLFAISSKRI